MVFAVYFRKRLLMIFILSSILLNAIAQVFMKLASAKNFEFRSIITNWSLMIAGSCYILSILLWLKGLSGTPLSKAYPLQSLGYILVFATSYFVLKESISFLQILGLLVICLGILILGAAN